MSPSIFNIGNEHLSQLSPGAAVDRVRELLWAESSFLGIGRNLINVPSAINVADGGIDAEVRDVEIDGGHGIIKSGLTRYQIKTGEFNLGQARYLNEILFSSTTNEIKPRIKSCLDQEGTFVIILFGWDNPETTDDQIVDRCHERLAQIDEKYRNAKIEIWRQNNLRSFFELFTSLSLKITGRDTARFQSHDSWSRQQDMKTELQIGSDQDSFISSVREQLRIDDQPIHVRVCGDPGIGKTRLLLEATAAEDLQPVVIYCDSASKFRDSDLMDMLLRDNCDISAVLVIDECDTDSRAYIWNKLMNRSPRIKLVTIHNELDTAGGRTLYVIPPPLSSDEIVKIVCNYDIPEDQARRWVELCSGSPRVAHVIGNNLKYNPDDVLKSPDTVDIWGRYIVGRDDPSSQPVRERRLVLRYLSLFKKFGFGRPLTDEAKGIAALVNEVDAAISWGRFQEIVSELRSRKILQGETTLYITPKALHIWLWIEWWDNYGEGFDLTEFVGKLTPTLVDWFLEMFKYAAESETASRVVTELLGPGGPFHDNEFLRTELGGRFFLALTEANPRAALKCLKSTVGTWDLTSIQEFTTGRRHVVWALERIAVWRELFREAAELLLTLAERENETYANNSTGVFVGLFSPATGRVAPTEASPEERLPVLEAALASESSNRRSIALQACDAALSTGPFSRSVGAEHQGLKREPELWRPETYGELFDAYRRAWELVCNQLDRLEGEERDKAAEILLNHTRGITRMENLSDMVITTVRALVDRGDVDKRKILGAVLNILRYEGSKLPVDTRKAWETIRGDLTGSDFASLLRRYVGTDFLEDRFDDQGRQVDQKEKKIEGLAREAIDNPGLLKAELNWLVTAEAEDGFRFGYELGQRDQNFALAAELLQAQQDAAPEGTLFFLGGYLRSLSEREPDNWEELLDDLSESPEKVTWVPELTWRSNRLTLRAARRILELAEKRTVAITSFRMFVYGGVIRQMSDEALGEWLEFLIGVEGSDGASVALELCGMYQHGGEKQVPAALLLRVLLHQYWFTESDRRGIQQHDDYTWCELADSLIERDPEAGLGLAEKVVDHFGMDRTIFEHSDRVNELLRRLVESAPEKVWEHVAKNLGPPLDSRAFHLRQWLRSRSLLMDGQQGALSLFPRELVWEWVEEDPENRAWYLASFIPQDIEEPDGLVRELLIKYGDRDNVRSNLSANYSSEGWTGPASAHYEDKMRQFVSIRDKESERAVLQWLNETIDQLDREIQRSRIDEERQD